MFYLFYIFLFFFPFFSNLEAQEINEINQEIFEIPFRSGDRMVLKGLFSHIRIIENRTLLPSKSSKLSKEIFNLKLTVRTKKTNSLTSGFFANPNFLIQRENSTVYVTHEPKVYKKILAGKELQVKKEHLLDVQIEGPSIPLEVYMREADVRIFSWSQDLKFVQMSGKIQSEKTKGKMMLYIQEGQIHMREHKGPLEVEGYRLHLNFEKIKGKLKLENFLGPTTKVTSLTGPMNMYSYKGNTDLSFIRGSVRFDYKDSNLTINDLRGELRGKSRKGRVKATLRNRATVSIQTDEGHINIRALNSGASVRLSSSEGYITAPNYLRKIRGYGQYRSGRLRGAHPGRIVIKTRKGNIRLK